MQGCAPVMDPCQTAQQTANHANPAAVSIPTAPGGLQSGTGQQQGAPADTLHPAGQSGGRNAAGGAESLTATAVSLFGLSPDS